MVGIELEKLSPLRMSFVKLYKTNVIPHVETVVSLSHKNADTHINVNVEFGDEEG